MTRFIEGIILTLILSVVVYFAFLHFEKCYLLKEYFQILPTPDQDQPLWLDNFFMFGRIHLLVAAGITIVWMLIGQFAFELLDKSQRIWGMLLGLQIISIVIFFFLIPDTQGFGKCWAIVCYAVNALFIYLLASIFQSPANVMFAPKGAKFLYRNYYKFDSKIRAKLQKSAHGKSANG